MVASARLKSAGRETIATYSFAERKWAEYATVDELWSVSVSADSSKLAFVREEQGSSPALYFIDTKTGQRSPLVSNPVSGYAAPSWSPDGEGLPTKLTYQDVILT